MEFKKYNYREIVEAVQYKEGMEDGFNVRWARKADVDKFKAGKSESYPTSGFGYGNDDDVEIKVPYVLSGNHQILVGNNYMIIKKADGSFHSMEKDTFDNRYKLH